MTFDANGNLTVITDGSQTTSLTWDARDRLIGLEQPGTLASFAYAFGRRLAKTVNGAVTQFLYDGLDFCAAAGGAAHDELPPFIGHR